MAKNTGILHVHTVLGVARACDKHEHWARAAFKSGLVPTEVLINGTQVAITDETLKKIAPALSARRPGHRLTAA